MELLGSLPTTWDTTIILEATIGDHIVTARRNAHDWYIAGMCAVEPKDFDLNLSFLTQGNYAGTICKDGINADRNAMDYVIEKSTLQKNENVHVHLAPNGGFLIRLRKE
jgi:alpha-glucosidase